MKNNLTDPLDLDNIEVQEQIDLLSVGDILSFYRPQDHSPAGAQGEYNEISRSIILEVNERTIYVSVIYANNGQKTSENLRVGKDIFFRYPWGLHNAA